MTDLCSGPSMLFRSAFLYSLLEFQAGHVRRINVEVDGNRMSITDDGRGHAIEREVKGIPYVKLIYSQLHVPFENGKMPQVAIHALGVSLFSAFCEELAVVAKRDNKIVEARFEDAVLVGVESRGNESGQTGNAIRFTLSARKLKEKASIAEIRDYLSSIKATYPSLELTINGEWIKV